MDIVFQATRDGRDELVLATGMSERDAARSKISQEISASALVLDAEGSASRWHPEGTFCDVAGQGLSVFGPAFPGVTLLASARGSDQASAWANLHRVASAVKKALVAGAIGDDELRSIAGAGPEAIVCGDDGRILFLPEDLYVRALASHPASVALENRAFWVHPDAESINASWSFAFLMGTIAYRVVTGSDPFPVRGKGHPSGEDGSAQERISRNMRQGIFEPVELARWNVRKQAAECINALVSAKVAASTDTLLAFGSDISSILDPSKEGVEPPTEFYEQKRSESDRRAASVGRESFVRRHKRSFLIGSIAAAFFGILLGVYLRDMANKPTTAGLSADEVIGGYYAGISRLDQEIPSAYAAKGIKADYADMLAHLFVTAKMRETYEQKTGIISPAVLFLEGSPGKKIIFGLSHLEIRTVRKNALDARYDVSYYLWIPVIAEGSDQDAASANAYPLSVYLYRESVTLSAAKGRWLITSIIPSARTLVECDSERVLSKISSGKANKEPWAPLPEEIAKEENR